ncbi:MAG: energy-coupled thiamine transporter ThiT [Massiliimalia sp.]|jgi:thiamine transporter
MNNENTLTRRMVETALLFAMAVLLSMVKLWPMPWGGSVTLCSMLPIILISYRYGVKWGFFSSFVYALLQMVLDLSSLRAISGITLVGSLLFDYILGFGILGIGGLFRNRIKNAGVSLSLGCVVAIFGRYLCSFASGFLLWGSYAEDTLKGFNDGFAALVLDNFSGWGLSAVYSLLYNGAYLLPELILTIIIALIIAKVPVIGTRYQTK